MTHIDANVIANAMTYEAYYQLILDLSAQGKTTGPNQSEMMVNFTQLNGKRMSRLNKKAKLIDEAIEKMKAIETPMTWLVLTEAWCGDAAQILPVLQHMVEVTPNVEMKLILRDENPEIMDAFLTGGSRSIPVVIFLDSTTLEVLGSWGPRPELLQKIVMDHKEIRLKEPDTKKRKEMYNELNIILQKWYNSDKGVSTQKELLESLPAALAI